MTEKLIAAVKCPCGTITAAEDGATSVTCAACGRFFRWGQADTDARPAQDRPMRPGWEPHPRFANCSRRVVVVTVDGCESCVEMDVRPALQPGNMAWTVDAENVLGDDESRIAFGSCPDEPAAQLAAESACRDFARALLREVGE